MVPNRITTVLTPAASYDLTDLDTAKDEISLSTTAEDGRISRFITGVSKTIASYCGMVFPLELVKDEFLGWGISPPPDGSNFYFYPNNCGSGPVADPGPTVLSRWPVMFVLSVVSSNGTAMIEGVDFRVDYERGLIRYLGGPFGFLGTVTYVSGFGTKATQSSVVPAAPGPYTVTLDDAAKFQFDGGVIAVGTGDAFVPVSGAPAQGQYACVAGVYTFNALDAATVVSIAFAYTTIPEDLADATLQLVTRRYKQRGRDATLVSESNTTTGDRRYWVGGVPGQDGPFPPDIAAMLDGVYRAPRVA